MIAGYTGTTSARPPASATRSAWRRALGARKVAQQRSLIDGRRARRSAAQAAVEAIGEVLLKGKSAPVQVFAAPQPDPARPAAPWAKLGSRRASAFRVDNPGPRRGEQH